MSVEVDEGDGRPTELARDGARRAPDAALEVRLPMTSPLRGTLRVEHGARTGSTADQAHARDSPS